MKWNSSSKMLSAIFIFVVLAGASNAAAKDAKFGIGVRPLGFSINPDQFTAGVQTVLGSVSKARFAPSVDFGFGDNVDLILFNLDLKIDLFSLPKSRALFYAGAGPTINIISPDVGDEDTEIGLGILAGMKLPFGQKHYYNLEARFGAGDVPDFKMVIGAMFGFGRVD